MQLLIRRDRTDGHSGIELSSKCNTNTNRLSIPLRSAQIDLMLFNRNQVPITERIPVQEKKIDAARESHRRSNQDTPLLTFN